MADPRPVFVLAFERRALFHLLFVLCVAYAGWFIFVLFGEIQSYTDDPGSWTGIPSVAWAYLGVPLFVLFAGYALGALTIREQPPRVIQFESDPSQAAAPSFLEEETAEEALAETEPEPGQG